MKTKKRSMRCSEFGAPFDFVSLLRSRLQESAAAPPGHRREILGRGKGQVLDPLDNAAEPRVSGQHYEQPAGSMLHASTCIDMLTSWNPLLICSTRHDRF